MPQIHEGKLYKVLRDFHTLTGVYIELLDSKLNSLVCYPPEKTQFCQRMAEDAHLGQLCRQCDWQNSQLCAKTGNVVQYRCHMGLAEAIAPIVNGGQTLGYVMFGQVLSRETSAQTRRELERRLPELSHPGITDAIAGIPVKSAAELSACVTILQSLAAYFMSNQWIAPERSEFIHQMDQFIEANLHRSLTVDDVCAAFHLRRTKLYSLAEDYLDCSIAAYIRRQRVRHACRMLRETDLSVTQIAEAAGFSDYRHFSRIFHQLQGETATDYRRNARKDSRNSAGA